MALHAGEIPIDEAVVRALLAEQRPEWAGWPLAEAGSGTDNVMFRLGDDLLVRLPRTAEKSRALAKERTWLPRLRPRLSRQIPEPVYAGSPGAAFPLPWSVFGWIDGEPPHAANVGDWAAFGADLAAFVRELHGIDLMGQTGSGDLRWYRGGSLRDVDWVQSSFEGCRAVADIDDTTWARARAWAVAVGVSGIAYYWHTYPSFVAECRARLESILAG